MGQSTSTRAHRSARGIRTLVTGITVGALAVLGWAVPAQAAVNLVDAPTRLYILPNADGPLPAGIPFPLVPDGVLVFDDSQDLISQDLRKIEIVSEDPDCDFGPTFALTGCTAVQLDVGNGLLDFTTAPTRIEFDPNPDDGVDETDVVYQLPGGALVRDMDSDDDLPASATAVIGTTAQINDGLNLLRYTPTEGYTYEDGSDPEELSILVAPGSGAGSVSHDVQIRVQDLNDFPELTVPQTLYTVDPAQEVVLGPDTAWEATDEDNDEVIDGEDPPGSGDDPIDGAGREFILIAWSSCGVFHFQGASGFALRDDLQEVLDYALDLGSIDPAWRTTISDAFFGIIPDEIEALPFATGNPNDYASAFAGVVDDIDWLNYHLDEITFKAVSDPVLNTPLSDSLCDIRFLLTDIGNNGLPLQYLGDPPEGVEVPFFGFDLDTNDVPGVEKVQVQVGAGQEIEVSLGDTTVPEADASTIPVTISPAEHPAFDLTVSTADGSGAVGDVDYTSKSAVTVSIPADATSAAIPVDALPDTEYDPDETYLVTATGPATPPPGYSVTLTDASGLVTIQDDDPEPDTTEPTVTINQAVGQSDPTSTEPILFDVIFSEDVTGLTNTDVVLSGTALPTTAAITPLTASTYRVAVTGMSVDGTVTAQIAPGAAEDTAGNLSEASTSTDNTVTFDFDEGDITGPTVTINQAVGQSDPTSTEPILFDVIFSEDVTGLTNTDVVLSGTALPTTAAITPLTASTYRVAVTGMSVDGTVIAQIAAFAAEDAAGNLSDPSSSTDNTVTYDFDEGDITGPTVTINQAVGQSDPTSTEPILFDVIFSEDVTGLTNTDVVLSGTALPTTAAITPLTASTYRVAVTGMSVDGTVTAQIAPGAAEDTAGNLSEASTSTDNTVTFDFDEGDITGPTVTINQAVGQSDPTSTEPILFTVVFSEDVTGLTNTDVVLSGTALPTTALITPIDAKTYTVAVTGMSVDGTVTAQIAPGAAEDTAGNPSEASTSTDNTVTFDFDEGDPEPDPLAIQVPADIVVTAPLGQPGVAVTFPAPTTTGGVEPVDVTCDHTSGAVYPIGATTVECTATDSAPIQVFALVSDTFTITVLATPDPGGDDPGNGGSGGSGGSGSGGSGGAGSLPATGVDAVPSLAFASALLLAGALALSIARRRRGIH
ncbi:LPXTG cell wall anchor domain-containing protein [Microbacterium sp. SS28]|uniref:LPXTG cell wall anchor domain-containing protein n=1 Tax=Microbacterium sp. SS28 TaxID=2919948 RepID=UPI001FAB0AAF|nr:LPXTG cell wall anchor domain-containing protein [Microbacterium sp. SS28]